MNNNVKIRKRKKTTYKITLIKFKDLPIGGLFYIKGWNGAKAIKTSDCHAYWKSFSGNLRFKFKPDEKIKPVFFKGTKNIVVEGD